MGRHSVKMELTVKNELHCKKMGHTVKMGHIWKKMCHIVKHGSHCGIKNTFHAVKQWVTFRKK